jgi:protein-S-isoprenylcysteine O-methyltransferase Ste14
MQDEVWRIMQLIYIWLLPAIWAIWWGYWLLSSRNVHHATQTESRTSRAIHLALVCVAFALIALPIFRAGPLGWRWLPRHSIAFILGTAILIASSVLAISARRHLGQYWSGTIGMKEEHQLIRSGPYAFVRHPIYTGFLGGMIGTAIALGELRGVLAVIVLLVAYLRKIRVEEKRLVQRFGESYIQYRKEVRMLVPFVI